MDCGKGQIKRAHNFINEFHPVDWNTHVVYKRMNIIGNTPKKVFDRLNLEEPVLIKPGNKVSFYQISKEEYLNWNE